MERSASRTQGDALGANRRPQRGTDRHIRTTRATNRTPLPPLRRYRPGPRWQEACCESLASMLAAWYVGLRGPWHPATRLSSCSPRLGGTRDSSGVTLAAMQALAERTDVDRARIRQTVQETLESMRDSWPHIEEELPDPSRFAKRLHDYQRSVPLVRPLAI